MSELLRDAIAAGVAALVVAVGGCVHAVNELEACTRCETDAECCECEASYTGRNNPHPFEGVE